MKTPLLPRLPRLLLLAVWAGIATAPASAQSFYERMRNDGCPSCAARFRRGAAEFGDDATSPTYQKPNPAPDAVPNPGSPAAPPVAAAPAAGPAVSTAQVLATAVASAAANPTLSKEQAAGLAAKIATGGPEIDFRPGDDGYLNVNFGQLASYQLEAPAPGKPGKPGSQEKIPELLRKLDGRHVRMSGFMLPMKVEGGMATEFLVVRSPVVCCYGVMPAPNEWVCVKASGKGFPMQMDTPLQFSGVLHVGEIYENEFFVGVYRLDADKVSVN
ncbi:MAG TPA: DUF3299 domain-containing protein [Lacunisphaera sp.]|nr:DUF3299 domain-containing protein [Lacunisphaera sp.]